MTRIERLAAQLPSDDSAAIVTSEVNRRYLTGFGSSDGYVFVTKERSYFITDSRYFEKAAETVSECKVMLQNDFQSQMNYLFAKHAIRDAYIEASSITVKQLTDFMEYFPNIEFDSSKWLSDAMTKMRIIKTDEEIKKIETAQRIAEKAYEKLVSKLRPGMTEKQVAALLNFYMMDYGADDISFSTIAASGKNSACPHAEPTCKSLEPGDFLTLDFGAVVDGYHSDMTRTLVIGKPTEAMKRVYDAVWSASGDALKAVRSDITAKLVDSVARSTLEAWGYEKFFGHGLGHGVGLEIHEAPGVSPRSDITLHENMIITIEPGVYIPHKFGVRIEDMVVVTKTSCVNLTKTAKSLVCV